MKIPRIAGALATGALLAIATVSPGAAQQVIPPGQFRIGPYPAACGQSVTIITDGRIGDVARGGNGQIYLNGQVFFRYPLAVQAFIYAHECMHALGDLNEQSADCRAIQIGRAQGWVNRATLPQLCESLMNSPGDWSHLPGPQRCQMMIACAR